MAYPNAIEVCRAELFTKEVELRDRYPQALVDKVLRVREMYNWFISNPDGTDREFVAEVCQRHGIHRTTAYSDLAVVKSLLPMLGSASRDFHRWCANGTATDSRNQRHIRDNTTPKPSRMMNIPFHPVYCYYSPDLSIRARLL